MSLADPTAPAGAVARPLAVLSGSGLPSLGHVRRALEGAGHRVRDVADVSELAGEGDVAVVVVDARDLASVEVGDETWASVAASGPELFAVHPEDDDVSELWRSYRRGAVPWLLGAETMPGLAPATSSGGELALDALHDELLGRHVESCRLLASIRDDAALVEVVDVLVAAGAAALERLRHRSRYPVPTALLVEHLPAHVGTLEGADFSLWWNMVEAAAFRASGLRLPVPDMGPAGRPHAVAFGAFHATSTIVRFTARRQWRKPGELLADLAEVV